MLTTTKREAATTVSKKFPKVESVILEDLPSLVSFSSTELVEWQSLKNVTVKNCPNLKKSGLGKIKGSQLQSVKLENQVLSNLFDFTDDFQGKVYQIDGNEQLSNSLIVVEHEPRRFTSLQRFVAKRCNERLNTFLSNLMHTDTLLEDITIEDCEPLKHVFDLEKLTPDVGGSGKYFTLLNKLTLVELPKLSCIWNKDPTGILGLSKLQIIHIKSCHSLKDLISASAAEKLQQLQELKVQECNIIEQIVVGMETELTRRVIKLPLLSNVELMSLSKLIKFHSEHYAVEFPGLKKLTIENCPELKEFTKGFASEDESSTIEGKPFIELNELKLERCGNLVYVISSNTLQEWKSLEKLTVSHCNSLKTIFKIQGEVSHFMENLSELNLTDLPNLIQISNKESTRLFQNLQVLRVKQCKSLSGLAAGSVMLRQMEISDCEALEKITLMPQGTSIFPTLETLAIENCPSLNTIFQGHDATKDNGTPAATPPDSFFQSVLSLNKLNVLRLKNQDNFEKLWENTIPSHPESFCELEELILCDNNKMSSVIPFSLLIRFNKLKKMTVERCRSLMEIFDLEVNKQGQIYALLPQLRVLILSKLSGLIKIWSKEPQVPFFQNLESLHIVDCGKLQSAFPLSAAKNFKQLKLLKLYNCGKMERVISEDEDGNLSVPEEIIFPKVECLILKDLPNLLSFCELKKGTTFNWPKLHTVRVSNIPSMKTFYEGDVITPLLRSVFVTFVEKYWQGKLNSTISYIHKNAGT